MRNINRRKLISLGAQGLGAACLPSWFSQTAAAETDEPHFFLEIFFPGGLDGLYTFDARSLAMTQAGLIANYQSAEPVLLTGKNGNKTLVTKLIDPLKPFLDRFSVLNGVIMDPGFDGHDNNINYLLSGNSFGGESMLPHINQVGSRTPLDYVSTGGVYIGQNISNSSNSASLNPASANGLAKRLSGQFSLDSSSSNMAFMKSRMAANAGGKGRFSAGAKAMGEGLDKAPQLSNSLKMLAASPEGSERTLEIATLIGELFKHNSCKSVQLVIDSSVISGLGFDLNLDTHSADLAKQSVEMIGPCMTALANIIKYLSNTPYNSKLSLLDVTTVLVGTEFGRSMRSEAKIDVKTSGTDHNPLKNTIMLGGKGIKGGLVVGASDFKSKDEVISGAHKRFDPSLIKSMGRPLNFASLLPADAVPDEYRSADYLNFGCIANTVYKLFGAPTSRYRVIDRNGPVAQTLDGLLA